MTSPGGRYLASHYRKVPDVLLDVEDEQIVEHLINRAPAEDVQALLTLKVKHRMTSPRSGHGYGEVLVIGDLGPLLVLEAVEVHIIQKLPIVVSSKDPKLLIPISLKKNRGMSSPRFRPVLSSFDLAPSYQSESSVYIFNDFQGDQIIQAGIEGVHHGLVELILALF